MAMIRTAMVLGVSVLCAALALAQDKGTKDKDKGGADALLGGYTMTGGEHGGKKIADEKIDGHTVQITKDRIVVTDKKKQEIYTSTYTIDADKKPWKITMTSEVAPTKGKVAKGLIEKDGDTVRLIYALPEGETPTKFAATTKDQIMVTMKNANKDGEKDKKKER